MDNNGRGNRLDFVSGLWQVGNWNRKGEMGERGKKEGSMERDGKKAHQLQSNSEGISIGPN